MSKMRVIHPGDFRALPKKRARKPKLMLLLILAVAAGGFFWYYGRGQDTQQQKTVQEQDRQPAEEQKPKTGRLKVFTGPQFKALARAIKYPNTQSFAEPPEITGNKKADETIRRIAESRGFMLTSIPVTSIQKINEPRLDLLGDDLLQPLAALAWSDLKAAAKRDDVPLALLSAYRSPKYQRDLFVSRLTGRGVGASQIAAGKADSAVEATLKMTAPPGYSRHHTGYTIDLWCEDGSGAFVNSSCFRWIKADNYKVAKQAGWIPSYPDGVELQGPEPEPWEYVWVGKDLVTN